MAFSLSKKENFIINRIINYDVLTLIEHTPVRGDSLALYSLYCIRSNKTQES